MSLEQLSKAWKKDEGLKIRGRIETLQATALLRSVRILLRVLEACVDLLSQRLQ